MGTETSDQHMAELQGEVRRSRNRGVRRHAQCWKEQPRRADSRRSAKPPLEQRDQFSTDMRRGQQELDMSGECVECAAALAPKTAGANTLATCRPSTSLRATKKLVGCMFLASFPILEFKSRRTAFIKGCHANMGAHEYLRIGEFVQGMGQRMPRCAISCTEGVRPRLSRCSTDSPIISVMILECVVRRFEEKWERLGWGFRLDGKHGQAQAMQTTCSSSAPRRETWNA